MRIYHLDMKIAMFKEQWLRVTVHGLVASRGDDEK